MYRALQSRQVRLFLAYSVAFSQTLSCVSWQPRWGARPGRRAPTNAIRDSAETCIDRSEQSVQDGLLHVHAIFGLIEGDGLRTVEHFGRDFQAAVRRKAVHEHGVRRSKRHQPGIYLIRLEHGVAHFLLGFEAHASPRIGVDRHGAADSFARVSQEFDLGASFAGHALPVSKHLGSRRVVRRRGDAQMNPKTGRQTDQRVADVVAVADVSELEAAQSAKFFFQGEEIRQRLARMKPVGKGVDHRDAGGRGHFFKDALVVNARDDALHPAFEVPRNIGDGLASAERRGSLCMVEEHDRAAHALNADIEGDARAQRRLLENEGDEFALEGRSVTARTGLNIRREMEQFARMRASNDEGRQQAQREVVGAVDEQTAPHGFGDKRSAFDGELDTDHQAFAADFTDEAEFGGELRETLAQLRAAHADIFEKFLALDDAEKFERNGTSQRAAAKGGAVHAGRDTRSNRLGRENGAERKAGGQRLGDQNDVRLRGKLLVAEKAAGAAEPALNLIGNQKGIMLRRKFPSAIPEGFVERTDPAFALNRFEENGADGIVEFRFEIGDVVETDELCPGNNGGEGQTVFFRGGNTDGAKSAPMKRIFQGQKPLFLRGCTGRFVRLTPIKARKLHRAIDRFGAAVGEERAIESRPCGKFARKGTLKRVVIEI